jgi:plastocyanin
VNPGAGPAVEHLVAWEVVMRRSVSIAVALALLLGAFALGEGALGATTPPPVKKIAISGTACANGLYCYKPAALTVKKGTKVIWTNASGTIHTVTRCTKAACKGANGGTGKQTKLASPSIQPHKTYAFTFTGLGTYRYYCKVHGYGVMHGTITVKA